MEGGVTSVTNVSVAAKVLSVMPLSFIENLSLLLASSRGPYLILYNNVSGEFVNAKQLR